MAVSKPRIALLILVGLWILLPACDAEEKPQLRNPATPTPLVHTPEPIPPPEPAKVLSICLGQEPASLFPYGDGSMAAKVIRQAIYDGPVDTVDFEQQPVILNHIPSRENGAVHLEGVEVTAGETMVDSTGNITFLGEGVTYRPSGCTSIDCEQVYSGRGSVTLDRVVIQYQLLPGILWSDGHPLTARDSLFSYRIAQGYYGEFGPAKLRYAESYRVVDDLTLQWVSLPGYQALPSYADFFFTPLPEHAWSDVSTARIPMMEDARKSPLGWGPYQIEEWIVGDHLTLTGNEHYYRGGEDMPYYDEIVFRFLPGVEASLNAFRAGECRIVLDVTGLTGELSQLESPASGGELNVLHLYGGAWEQILFGIQSLSDGATYLEQRGVRQAIAGCVDRQAIVNRIPQAPRVAESYYPTPHPKFNPGVPHYPYDPQGANQRLQDLGWVDHDQDPLTPRQSAGVEGVDDGTPFQVTIFISQSEKSATIAEIVQTSLAGCGVQVDIEMLPAGELLAPGPEGPVFGRAFDMAQFAWTVGRYQLCSLFLSSEVPGPPPDYPKAWGGGNAAGYTSKEFDSACREDLYSLPDLETTKNATDQAQLIFAEDLPALPLYFRQKLYLADPSLIGLRDGVYIPLWNIESLP